MFLTCTLGGKTLSAVARRPALTIEYCLSSLTYRFQRAAIFCGFQGIVNEEKNQGQTRLSSSFLDFPVRIPDDFPQVAIGIRKIAGIPAPKRILCRFDDGRTGLFRLLHHRIHFFFTAYIMADRAFRGTWPGLGNFCVVRNIRPRPKRELQPVLQIEKGDCAMLKFRADDPVRRQPQPVAIKLQRPLQIVHALCNDCDSWFHLLTARWKLENEPVPDSFLFLSGTELML